MNNEQRFRVELLKEKQDRIKELERDKEVLQGRLSAIYALLDWEAQPEAKTLAGWAQTLPVQTAEADHA